MNHSTFRGVSSPRESKGLNDENQALANARVAETATRLASFLLIALVLFSTACRQTGSAPPQIQTPSPKSSAVIRTEIGFASRQKFSDHYDKHGDEFGSISKDVYLRQAQELRDRPLSAGVLESVRSDGVITRFDKNSGAFLAFNSDLTIRTYFKPNDGEAYFQRQSKRGSNRSSNGGDNE